MHNFHIVILQSKYKNIFFLFQIQVNGRLGMTRSIGDTDLKGFGVVAHPHLKSLEVS